MRCRAVLIVPTLRVGMPPRTLRVPKATRIQAWRGDAERHGMNSHAERGNDPLTHRASRRTGFSREASGFAVAFDLVRGRPYTTKRDLGAGRTQTTRSGSSGMDAARAPSGHGCPFGAGPRSVVGVRVLRRRRSPTRSTSPWLLGALSS